MSIAPTAEPIGQWTVNGNDVSLCKEGDRFVFIDANASRFSFETSPYTPDYAQNLVGLFSRTIQKNLELGPPCKDSFLPKWCTSVKNIRDLNIGLFWKVDLDNPAYPAGELAHFQWGVYNAATSQNQTFPATDLMIRRFAEQAPEGDLREYAKKHRVVGSYNTISNTLDFTLQRISEFDPEVGIDDNRCALTLADTGASHATHPGTWGGHACLYIEGVDNGSYWIRAAHLVSLLDQSALSGIGTVKLRRLDQFDIKQIHNRSATWARNKAIVQVMLDAIQQMIANYPQFYLHLAGKDSILVGESKQTTITDQGASREVTLRVHNCFTWAKETLKIANIDLYTPDTTHAGSLLGLSLRFLITPKAELASGSVMAQERVYVLLPLKVMKTLTEHNCLPSAIDITTAVHEMVKQTWKACYSKAPTFMLDEKHFEAFNITTPVTDFNSYQEVCRNLSDFKGRVLIPITTQERGFGYLDMTLFIKEALAPPLFPGLGYGHPILAPNQDASILKNIAGAVVSVFSTTITSPNLNYMLDLHDPNKAPTRLPFPDNKPA